MLFLRAPAMAAGWYECSDRRSLWSKYRRDQRNHFIRLTYGGRYGSRASSIPEEFNFGNRNGFAERCRH